VSVSERERQALASIEHDLAGSAPALVLMPGIFSQLSFACFLWRLRRSQGQDVVGVAGDGC